MQKHHQDPGGYRAGDKIRIRCGPDKGARGVIEIESDDVLHVRLENGKLVRVQAEDLTNYSLAARRAWDVMPKRAGRPKLSEPRKKMISMRLDIDLWDRLGVAVANGLVSSREEAVNTWLRESLDALLNNRSDQED